MRRNWWGFMLALVAAAVLAPIAAGVAHAADAAASPLQKVVDFLNSPTAKTALLLVGGFVMRAAPNFVNKAIPVALLVLSTLAQAIGAAFPAPAVQPAMFTVADYVVAASGGGWGGFIMGSVLPALLAVGINSGQKNLVEWARVGWAIHDATGKSGRGLG